MATPRFYPNLNFLDFIKAIMFVFFCKNKQYYKQQYKRKLKSFFDTKYVEIFPMARLAIVAVIKSLIPENSEIIICSYNVPAVIEYLNNCNIKIKYIDADKYSYNLAVQDIIRNTTSNTRAIFITHLYGIDINFKKLINHCKFNNILLIEDAAQAFGVPLTKSFPSKYCGTVGDIGIFSTGILKVFSTFMGGFIITNNKSLYKRIVEYKNKHSTGLSKELIIQTLSNIIFIFLTKNIIFSLIFKYFKKHLASINTIYHPKYIYHNLDTINFKYFDNYQSFLGIYAFRNFNKTREIFKNNTHAINKIINNNNCKSNSYYIHYPLIIKNRNNIINAFQNKGYDIGPGKFYNFGSNSCSNGQYLYENNLNIPVHTKISEKDIILFSSIIKKYL